MENVKAGFLILSGVWPDFHASYKIFERTGYSKKKKGHHSMAHKLIDINASNSPLIGIYVLS